MPPLHVSPASPHELMLALRVLFGRRSESDRDRRAERCRAALGSGDRDAAVLFVTRDAGSRVNGAAMAQAMPGALGVAWPPHAESPEAEDALTLAASDWLRGRGVKVCQAFAAAGEESEMAALERSGFRHITQLVSMRRELSLESLPPEPRSPMVFSPYTPPLSDEFRSVLLTTHEGTRDCPELNGSRTPDQLLIGFAEPFPGGGWDLVRRADETVGVVIHSDGLERDTVELAYFGIVPAHRGRGIGSELLAQLLWAFHLAETRVLTLCVDARNDPALRLYRRFGFIETERREVWLAHL
jgi:mycothiol synthase